MSDFVAGFMADAVGDGKVLEVLMMVLFVSICSSRERDKNKIRITIREEKGRPSKETKSEKRGKREGKPSHECSH